VRFFCLLDSSVLTLTHKHMAKNKETSMEPEPTALEKIRQWQDAIVSERENLVNECQRQFAKAVELLKTIEELGVEHPFDHPSMVTFKTALERHFALAPMPMPPMAEKPRRNEYGSAKASILQALADGKDTPKRVLADRLPNINPATLNQSLSKMVRAKEIENVERGMYRLAPR
jgi:hypothetical protein